MAMRVEKIGREIRIMYDDTVYVVSGELVFMEGKPVIGNPASILLGIANRYLCIGMYTAWFPLGGVSND